MRSRIAQRVAAVATCAAALVSLGAGTASAGEITGKGKSLATVPSEGGHADFVIHAKSICGYSGLNDEYVLAQLDDDPTNDDAYARVQTPAEAPPGVPGFACAVGRPLG